MSGSFPPDNDLNGDYVDLMGMVSNRARETAGALTRVMQERPMLAAALAAGGFGALIGFLLANRSRSKTDQLEEVIEEQTERAGKQAKKSARALGKASDLSELLPIVMKLAGNPLIRGMVVSALSKSLAKKLKS
jgi:hypothetical protein